VERLGNKLVVGFGLILIALSLAGFALLSDSAPVWAIIGVTVLMGAGMGFVMAPATDSIMGSLPRAKAGVGSAMNDTTRQTGGAVGVAIMGSILASRFHTLMTTAANAHHLPPSLATAARVDLPSALRTAQTPAGAPYAGTIGSIARQSFVSSFHVAALVGAALILLAALGVFAWLPARAQSVEEPEAVAAPSSDDAVAGQLQPAFDG
jgi:hypothetical protein